MTTSLSPLQKAFMALQDAEARIAELEAARRAPIAVIGLGCRAPGGIVDADSFWRLLEEERDATGPVPADRWDHEALYDPDLETPGRIVTRNGGFLDRIDAFDPEFFGITPREAAGMDPQQRLVLEVCWEALESAGQAPTRLSGTSTGVFIGAAASDYAYLQLQTGDPRLLDAHFGSGMAHSVLSGRVAYLLGLQGPALTIDTACSSSLVAIHVACQALRAGDCRLALAGGVNLILAPDIFIALSRARMLAPDGRCKTFDAAADGFARGEGCAIVTLKLLADAVTDRDRVLAVIRGTAVNQDGPSSGLTAPNGTAQEAVIRAALAQADLAPGAVGYIEAHGTGTELGDPLEARALGAVFAKGRSQPLLIGSVKTNLGHLEGAAGAIGLVKTIVSLRHGVVPAHLHLTKPSEHIAWDDLNLTISPRAVAFPEIDGRRIAGVSSFGFSGTNAHVIVETPPEAAVRAAPARAWALPLSAPDAGRLADLASAVAAAITPQTRPADIARTLATGRAHLVERAVVRADSPAAAKAGFEAVAKGLEAPGVFRTRVEVRDPPRTAFLFAGQGSQYSGMGSALYAAAPAFRAAVDECDTLLKPLLNRSIKAIIFESGEAEALDQTGYAQPALFTFGYALAAFWRRLGVEPVAAMGHSVGEYVAACVSGAMSLEDAIALIAARARLMQSLPAGGAMAAVFAPEAWAAEMLLRFEGKLSLAAVNGPAQIVVSGEAAAVQTFCTEAEAAGIKTRPLHVSHAFHSPLMDPILDAFEREAGKVSIRTPAMQLISNLTGRAASVAEIAAPEYWRRHLRSPVRFADGLATLAQARIDICLEIGPHPTLTSFAMAAFDEGGPKLIASQRRGGNGWEQILDAVAQLHLAGVELDWSALDPEGLGVPIDLPLSPFRRERHWFEAKPAKAVRRSPAGTGHPILGAKQRSAAAQGAWELHSEDAPAWVAEHRVLNQVIAPGAMLIEMMRLASGGQGLSDIELSEALIIDPAAPSLIQTIAADEDGARRVFVASVENIADPDAPWHRHAFATVVTPVASVTLDLAAARAACPLIVDLAAYYASFAPRGYDFGQSFHSVQTLWKGEGVALGDVKIASDLIAGAPVEGVHPVLLDGCLQVAGAAMPAEAASQALLPVAMAGYHVARPFRGAVIAYARAIAAGDGYRADIAIYEESGRLAATLTGVRFVRASRAALAGRGLRGLEQSFYAINWHEAEPAPTAGRGLANGALICAGTKAGIWAVLSDDEAFADALVTEIEAGGGQASAIPSAGLREQLAELDGRAPAGVVVARSPDPDGASAASADLAALASALAERSPPPRLIVLTRGAQSVGLGEALAPQQAPFWGVARTLALELPELRTAVVDMDPARPVGETAAVAAELANPSGETQVALRGGKRFVPRLERRAGSPAKAAEPAAWVLKPASPGSYDGFVQAPLVRRSPGKGEVEIETLAWGLNFKDVLNAMDLYPGDPGPLGGESAGRIVAVGEGVEHLRIGDEVMAVAGGSFASHVIAPAALVQCKPKTMSFEEAACFPIPWLTAVFCLEHVAKLRPGERVLVHAGTGGVGLAAVRIAQRAGAEIFATAGSPWKRDLLEAAGVTHVYDSRTPAFADQILADTKGEGVQVVLNSLAGEMMDASFRATAKGGRFVEIGKRGLKNRAEVEALGRDIAYEIIDWGETAARDPALIGGMLRDLVEAAGELPPLPRSVFSVDEAGQAFRLMAQARHAGKIVLRRMPPATEIRADGTYLVSGGLGGVGLETARWLAAKGAGRLVLFGRKGLTPGVEPAIAEMRAAGAEIWTEQLDVADRAGLAALLTRIRASGFPLRGVIHAAGNLDNAALGSQNRRRFDAVFRAKHDGAAALDALTRIDPIEIFVLYSSVASVLGAAGQINYAAANAYMDALAHERRSRGVPALSVNWGAWSEVGAAAGAAATDYLAVHGLGTFTPVQGVAALERLLADGEAQAMVARLDWPAYLATRSASGVPPFLRNLANAEPPPAAASQAAAAPADGRAEIESALIARRPALIIALVTRIAAGVIGFAADRQIDPRMPLGELGLDSLMAVDLRNKLGRALGHRFPATLLFDYPTIGGLVEMIGPEVFGLAAQDAPKATAPTLATQSDSTALVDAIEGLDELALDRLLTATLGISA